MIRSIIIKILAKLFLFLGCFLRHSKAAYDFSKIRKILINKCDRFGDAVVTLPLLFELQKYYDITVLTSERNDEFLKRFVRTRKFIDDPRSFLDVLMMLFKNFGIFGRKKGKVVPEYDLYLDLNGIKELDVFRRVWGENLCLRHVSFNMGPWNLLLDYSHPDYSVLFSHKHILESYRELIRAALGRDIPIRDYYDLRNYAVIPAELPKGDFIIINIAGYEKFRGPSLAFFAELIKQCSSHITCFILDELGRPHLAALKEKLCHVLNVYLPERDFSVWELLGLVSRAKFYIGADLGVSHLMQSQTNAILFFGDQRAIVWRPYSQAQYEKRVLSGGFVIEQMINSEGLLKVVIYSQGNCRQCFDIGCLHPKCVNDFDRLSDAVKHEISALLERWDFSKTNNAFQAVQARLGADQAGC